MQTIYVAAETGGLDRSADAYAEVARVRDGFHEFGAHPAFQANKMRRSGEQGPLPALQRGCASTWYQRSGQQTAIRSHREERIRCWSGHVVG